MRAIGFFRLKSQERDSLPDMEREFREYCGLNLHQPIDTFASIGHHGQADDPEYRRMMDYMMGSGSEFLVVVPSARHLGSDLESVARAMVELEGIGATVRCTDEEFPDPLQNAFQTLGVKGVSRTRSRRIKESMRARALRGQALGKPPYGYSIGPEGSFEVVRDESNVVELIFRLYTRDQQGFRLIAQHLNERSIRTRRGTNWSVVSIRDVLRNPVYTGTYTRLGMRRPRTHDAIVPPEVFRAAQELTRSRRPIGRVSNAEPFLLSGLLACGYCGNTMMGVTRRQSWKRKDGRRARGVYRYYQCQSRNNQSVCGYHTWRAPVLEGTVLGQLRHALKARAARSPHEAEHGDSEDERARSIREARVTNAERRLTQAMRRAARGELATTLLGDYLGELDAARRAVSGELNPRGVEETLAKWDELGPDARRDFLTAHAARIVVKDETVDVVV